jgi:hypothetical protein
MLAQVIKSLSSTRSTSKQRSLSLWNIRAILFVTLFIAIELSSTVEARPARKTNAFRIVTVMSKEGRYLTIGKQGITGVYVYSPYGKNMFTLELISLLLNLFCIRCLVWRIIM